MGTKVREKRAENHLKTAPLRTTNQPAKSAASKVDPASGKKWTNRQKKSRQNPAAENAPLRRKTQMSPLGHKKKKQIKENTAESQSIVVQDNSNPYNTSPKLSRLQMI